MIFLQDLSNFLEDYMGFTQEVESKDPYMANGVQFSGNENINKIALGVSANINLFEKAKKIDAQAIIVHHSINFPSSINFATDLAFIKRFKYLILNNISLIGYHYLLDKHNIVGNNACILKSIGATPLMPYANDWGWIGEFTADIELSSIIDKCKILFDNNGFYYDFGNKIVKKVAVVSGGAPPRPNEYPLLKKLGVDLFITGEIREWNQELCKEYKISLIAGGHYNSEKIGIIALGDIIRKKFDIEVEFIDIENKS